MIINIFSKIFINYKKWYINIIFSFLTAILIYLFSIASFGRELEYKTIDLRFRNFTIPTKADTSIILIAIDDRSLEFFSEHEISWPWPRDFYAEIVKFLSQAGAETILFDILFFEKDIERDETNSNYTDNLFSDALAESGKVILAAKVSKDIVQNHIDLSKFGIKITNDISNIPKYYSGKFPLKKFCDSVDDIGIINIEPDSDGVIRRVPFVYKIDEYFLPQFALSAYLKNQKSREITFSKNKVNISDKTIPVEKEKNYFINWYSTGGNESPFTFYTFSSVIQSAFAEKVGAEASLDKNIFKDKIVIIGTTGSGIEDLIQTPFSTPFPGMELWATVYSNLINRDFAKNINVPVNISIIFLLNFLTYFLFNGFSNKKGYLFSFIPVFFYTFLILFLWKSHRILFSMSLPLLSFVIIYTFSALLSFFAEGRAKYEIKKIFSRYLHPDVIQNLLVSPDSIELGGKEIYATVLFTDIANFTTFSEGKRAPELINSLNEYFETLTRFVLENHGLLDKYTGDGIMAIFGAPLSNKDHAKFACTMAIAHKEFIEKVSSEKSELNIAENFHLHTRVGINSGLIVAGNLGSKLRMDYTAIGDDVNLAARLEGVNKIYKTHIIISDSTYQAVKEDFICRELDLIRVKGKNEPTTIFELIARKNKNNIEKFSWVNLFNEGISLYKTGKWNEAYKIFSGLKLIRTSDYATELFQERCKKLLENPTEKWDPVNTLTSK